MRVMVLVKATEDSEKGYVPDPWTTAMMEAMSRFNDELRKAGILIMADGLTVLQGQAHCVRWLPTHRHRRTFR